MIDLTTLLLVAGAYLLGSMASAVLVSRAMGLADPRTVGSRNPGATNVLRHGGRAAAALTLLGDVAKGLAPVLAARALDAEPAVLALVGLAAFLGHLYPLFFGFRGGKGVATACGVLLALSWPLGAATLVTWLLVAAVLRYSSLAAVAAAVLAPGYALALGVPAAVVAAVTLMAALLLWRHRSNIRNLMAGTEDKIGRSGTAG